MPEYREDWCGFQAKKRAGSFSVRYLNRPFTPPQEILLPVSGMSYEPNSGFMVDLVGSL